MQFGLRKTIERRLLTFLDRVGQQVVVMFKGSNLTYQVLIKSLYRLPTFRRPSLYTLPKNATEWLLCVEMYYVM
jgi:hypothetical protein